MQSEYEDSDEFFEMDEDSHVQNIEEVFQRPVVDSSIINYNKDIYVMGIDVSCDIRRCVNSNDENSKQPYVIIFGVNQHQNSIKVTIKNFYPYFYSAVPMDMEISESNLQLLKNGINERVKTMKAKKQIKDEVKKGLDEQLPDSVILIQHVHRVDLKYYTTEEQQSKQRYLKIYTKTPGALTSVRKLFLGGEVISGIPLPRKTYEANIPYILRYMIDSDIVGMGWFKIKRGMFDICQGNSKKSYCQVEIQCSVDAIESIKAEDLWAKIAPVRVLSFDIECLSTQGFPSAERSGDKIIQIACACKTSSRNVEDFKVVFALKGCSPISGVNVKEEASEQQMLLDFQKLIRSYDPDFLVGYNIINFDFKYIIERASFLGMKNYGMFGRSVGKISKIRDATFQSKVMGKRDTKQINIEGRIQLDMLIHMHRQHKLSSYTLNNVSYYFLKSQKEDVHHSQIGKLFHQSRQTRKRLAVYCLKDAQLPLALMQKLCCIYNYSEMARVTGVPINYLLNKGQQIKVTSQLLRKAKHLKYIMPFQANKGKSDEVAFEGASVLDPISGFYQDPIATLDFASLYPSIMMAHNLCYTTLVPVRPENQKGLQSYGLTNRDDYEVTPMGNVFVKKARGLLPEILRQLIAARKQAKKELAETTDPLMRAVLDGRQSALKISANSVYGYTGATVGHLPCLQISSSVTAYGRQMIQQTKNSVQRLYPGSRVIYGDTDSVMVDFPIKRSQSKQQKIKEAMSFGRDAAQKISQEFKKPIKLEFQKVYCPYLLITKKRYAGVYYTQPDKPDKIDKKGIQSVRRDNCLLIRQMLEKVINMVLWQNDVKGSEEYIKGIVSDLVKNKIDISKLVITKAITKKFEEQSDDEKPNKVTKAASKDDGKPKNTYKSKQAHSQLAQRMKKRDQNVQIHIGDRISYVMIMGLKGSKNYENSEDPIKVLNEDLPIDFEYYINKQLKPPLERLLKNSGIVKNFDSLFCGDHTKNRYIPKVKNTSFLGKFVRVQTTCLNCPNRLSESQALCSDCKGKAIDVYLSKQKQIQQIRRKFNELWVQCQNCQGSLTMPVICSNMDCPIYYQRIKFKNTITDKQKIVKRFKTFQYQPISQDNQIDF